MESGEPTRLLIATGAAAGSTEDLPRLVRALLDSATDMLVITPILTSRLQWLATDSDRARFEADERLHTFLSHIESLDSGATLAGQIGDEAPLRAFGDAIRLFRPHHILIALRAADNAGWQEKHLAERILERFHLPITMFELDRSGRVPDSG